jgi:c-di-GMP phosphodiesterase
MAYGPQELETVVVARQPIFDAGWDVIAYELLYRPISETADPVGPEAKTAGVLATTFSELGLDLLVGDRPAHINVTRDFLLDVRPLPLEPRRTVLELVEDQVVDAALVEVLGEAVDAGFTLALDDFRYAPKMEPVLDLATIVKLDVRALTRAELEAEVRKLEPRRLTLVAEKVETAEEYEICRELDFAAYQGYFFALPELSRTPATPTRELGTLAALAATDVDTSLETLEGIVRRDAGLSHKLLRYANSAHVSPLRPIASLRHALTMIGAVAISTTASPTRCCAARARRAPSCARRSRSSAATSMTPPPTPGRRSSPTRTGRPSCGAISSLLRPPERPSPGGPPRRARQRRRTRRRPGTPPASSPARPARRPAPSRSRSRPRTR